MCQNKIVIRRDGGAGTGAPARQPATTPTIVSTVPPPASSTAAPTPFAPDALPEQEMSESWREAIVDNRATIDLLKKVGGVPVPDDKSTAAGGKPYEPQKSQPSAQKPPEAAPPATPANYKELTPGDALDLATPALEPPRAAPAPPSVPRPASPARSDDKRGASAIVSLVAGFASLSVASIVIAEGTWAQGLGTLLAIGAAVFAGVACSLNGLLRRRGILALLAIVILAGGAATLTVLGVFLTGGDASHRMIEWHPFLSPLAPFVR